MAAITDCVGRWRGRRTAADGGAADGGAADGLGQTMARSVASLASLSTPAVPCRSVSGPYRAAASPVRLWPLVSVAGVLRDHHRLRHVHLLLLGQAAGRHVAGPLDAAQAGQAAETGHTGHAGSLGGESLQSAALEEQRRLGQQGFLAEQQQQPALTAAGGDWSCRRTGAGLVVRRQHGTHLSGHTGVRRGQMRVTGVTQGSGELNAKHWGHTGLGLVKCETLGSVWDEVEVSGVS